MEIYLVRHGETDWNQEGRVQGRENIGLNANGIAQAYALAKAFEGIKFDCIASSPLQRAVRTAEIVAERQGIRQVQIEADLIERDYGVLSGKRIRKEEKQALFADLQVEGLERMEELETRMLRVLRRYGEMGYARVLMVSHGAAINSVLSVLSHRQIGSGKTWLVNACINALAYEKGELRIMWYNKEAQSIDKL